MAFLQVNNLYKLFIPKQLDSYNGEISFTLLEFFGIWRPLTWKSPWKIFLFRIYSIIFLFMFLFIVFSFLLTFFRSTEDTQFITQNSFYFTASCTIYLKMINIMIQQKKVMKTLKMLTNGVCEHRSLNESKILQKCSSKCRYEIMIRKCDTLYICFNTPLYINFINFAILSIFDIIYYFYRLVTIIFLTAINLSAVSFNLTPLLEERIRLPFNDIWLPYTINSKLVFWLTYIYQSLSVWMAACVLGSFEGLMLVMILRICAQIDIIVNRLNTFPKLQQNNNSEYIAFEEECKLIRDCIRHHIHLYS